MKALVFLLAAALLLTVAPVVGFSQCADVDANTVLLFRFEEIQGDNTVTDYSGNNHNGTINGNIQVVEGICNNGYQFDGQSHIVVAKSGTLDIGQNLTIEVLARCVMGEGEQYILDKRGGSPREGYEMYLSGENIGILTHTHSQKVSVNTAPTFDEWQHYAVTYDGVNVKFYVAGELVAEAPQNDDLGIDSDLYIGAENGEGGFFNGALDHLRISNVARTAEELRESVTAVEFSGKLTTSWGRLKARY